MYFDEDIVLDLRLNTLDKYVDFFVIVESNFTHKGDKRELKYDLKKFNKLEKKIIYLVYAAKRENGQRNYIANGIKKASPDDFIMISDVDEIPNLSNFNFKEIENKIVLFKQHMFYYKFNLKIPNLLWTGTKGCLKKNLLNPQWI